MNPILVVRGRYTGQTFIPEEALPSVEGKAELIVYPETRQDMSIECGSIFDLFGKAPLLRTGEDIASQLREERGAWGEP